MADPNYIVVIPDTQVRDDVPTEHLAWAGWYIGEHFGGKRNITIVHLGDHWDMPSLSSYDRGKKAMEGRRYVDDIKAGNDAMDLLVGSMRDAAPPRWKPRRIFLHGNHENRITRAIEDNAQAEGAFSLDHLNLDGWEVYPFLDVVTVHGVMFSHYFYSPGNGRPYSGENMDTRLRAIGGSFVQGHQQGLRYGVRESIRGLSHGLVAGSFYQHSEQYRGPQARGEWRGIVVLNDVRDGDLDVMPVRLDYLARRYGKKAA